MADILCGYTADRDETLTAYLYGEIDPALRTTFEGHLATCERCRKELAELEGTRQRLQEWPAPELARSFVRIPADATIHAETPVVASFNADAGRRTTSGLGGLRIWAQAVAAMLLLGVSAGIANLDVHYDQRGLSIRTGWSRPEPQPEKSPAEAAAAAAPWRPELTALEGQLRAEIRGATAAAAVTRDAAADAQLLRRVRALIEDTQRKQQNELALRVAELASEWETKRKIDLKNIDWNLQAIQKDTGSRMVAGQKQLRAYIDNTATIMSRAQQR